MEKQHSKKSNYLFRQICFFFILLSQSFLAFSQATQEEQISMRRCAILPIADSVGGGIAFEVYQKTEVYLKESQWCLYQFNSQVMDILGQYRDRLDKHLENPDVLKMLALRLRVGSLFKIRISPYADGTDVMLEVFGANGRDVYFRQRSRLSGLDSDSIIQLIRDWLELYSKIIPYDAIVIGVLGDQVSFDLGKKSGVKESLRVDIVRPVGKETHPLLKEVVSWKTKSLARANVVAVQPEQGQAKVLDYDSNLPIQIGDWVKFDLKSLEDKANASESISPDPFKFGKLGEVGLYLTLGKVTQSVSFPPSTVNKMSGYLYGFHLNGEIWATRHFFGDLEFGKRFGTLRRSEGVLTEQSNNVDFGTLKFKAGYRFLPMGFFYGPRVDAYAGFARYSFGMENRNGDGLVASSYKGILLGTKCSMPIISKVRASIKIDFLLMPQYSEDVTTFGKAESVTSFNVEIGGTYKMAENISLASTFEYLSNVAKFDADQKRVSMKETMMKFGVIYTY